MTQQQSYTIECSENGPYLVKGLENLVDSTRRRIPAKRVMALCRCGASENKPFCDGTHSKIGFVDAKLDGGHPDRRDTYTGRRIAIHDNRGICSHAGFCTDELKNVWKMNAEPRIDADGEDVQEIVETIRKCPSGALSYTIEDDEHRDREGAPTIRVSRDGPYCVSGGVELLDIEWGDGASREHYTLCRCGGSKNKPFCDGCHWNIEFKDEQSDRIAEA